MKEKLEQFIKDNSLSFTVGQRNSNITTLSGYALYIGASIDDCEAAIPAARFTTEVCEELHRVYPYAERNNYAKFWRKKATKSLYKY